MTKMVKTKINGRWELLLPDYRAARPEWTSTGGWEKARLDHMHKTTKQGDRVAYIGAEEGDMCGLLSSWGAEVMMFEPNPGVWPSIKAIWEANKLGDFYAFAGFAGSTQEGFPQDKHLLHNKFPECADGPMIGDHGFKNLCEADGTIPIVKLDELFLPIPDRTYLGMVAPDMISLDVEGAEWEVLRGAEQTLRQYKPRIYLSLHPEFLYEIYREYANDLRHWLKELGYKETLLDYQHEVHLVYEAIE